MLMISSPARATTGIRAAASAFRSRMAWYHTHMKDAAAVNWSVIDTVLLDMDGTLLDLRFDTWFWQELIPSRYAAANSLGLEETRGLLGPKFAEIQGTLQWYCIDYWSRELKLDIGRLKREAQA